MSIEKRDRKDSKLHPRNKNNQRYDLEALVRSTPALKAHIQANKVGVPSIDFSNPIAVKILNKAILHYYYGIAYWDFPKENLCPPIPGRADYIHHIADLLSESNKGKMPIGENITCLDIGTGATCIYPIIGVTEYNWNFIGSDIDAQSIEVARKIVASNASLQGKITCKVQKKPSFIFRGILGKKDKIDMSICNPPFHSSIEEAVKGTRRKIKNLTGKKTPAPKRNFSGRTNELVYEGGEYQFLQRMIVESKEFAKNCFWFSSLVSKGSNLKKIYRALEKQQPSEIKTIPIGTGNKTSRIVAWTYFTPAERKAWQARKA